MKITLEVVITKLDNLTNMDLLEEFYQKRIEEISIPGTTKVKLLKAEDE